MGKALNVAMIGYQFMGRAHSNAWRQAAHFFDLPRTPVLKVVCGRNEAAVAEAEKALAEQSRMTAATIPGVLMKFTMRMGVSKVNSALCRIGVSRTNGKTTDRGV